MTATPFLQTQHEHDFPLESFRNHIQCILKLSRLHSRYIDVLTNEENIRQYIHAFTHSSVDNEKNYEWYEMMGDAILNKCMVYYINQRFPFLHNPEGVKVIARLKINLVSKKMFADLSSKLQFPQFIRFLSSEMYSNGNHHIVNNNKMNTRSLYEDVLEAFFGVTEWLMDHHFDMGSGHVVCYKLLSSIMDTFPISLRYEDLYDSITRLKETFDICKQDLWGQIKYENTRTEEGQHVKIFEYCHLSHRKVLLYECHGTLLDETKQMGAAVVLQMLKKRGFEKPTPPYYLQLQEHMKKYHSH